MTLNLKKSIPIEKFTLKNGLRVIIVNNSVIPIASINLSYRVGSKDEKFGKTGFAHLFEHLMFEGTKNLPKGKFDEICSSAGGVNNAYTTYDWTSYVMTVPSNQLELAFWLESDRMFNSNVTQKSLDNQKSVVIEEINQTVENQPYARWRTKQAQNAFLEKSPYSWEIHGKKADVANATLNDVREFHKKYYQPKNAVLTISGNINFSEAEKYARKYFEKEVESVEIIRKVKDPSTLKTNQYGSFKDDVPLNAVFVSNHTPNFLKEETYTADVLAYIIGVGKSSSLNKSLVHEKEIASQVGCLVDKRELGSLFTIYAIANDPSISNNQLFDNIYDEIHRIKNESISEKELDKAKNLVTTSIASYIQSSEGIADAISNLTLFQDTPQKIYDVLDKYHSVSRRDVEKYLSDYIDYNLAIRTDVEIKGEK